MGPGKLCAHPSLSDGLKKMEGIGEEDREKSAMLLGSTYKHTTGCRVRYFKSYSREDPGTSVKKLRLFPAGFDRQARRKFDYVLKHVHTFPSSSNSNVKQLFYLTMNREAR